MEWKYFIESKKDDIVKDGIALKNLTLTFRILSLNIKMALASVCNGQSIGVH